MGRGGKKEDVRTFRSLSPLIVASAPAAGPRGAVEPGRGQRSQMMELQLKCWPVVEYASSC